MTNGSGSLTFDDKIFGNRRYEQVFWVRSWLLSDEMDIHILYEYICRLRLYYNVNLCMRRHIVDVEYLFKSERNFISMYLLGLLMLTINLIMQ